MRAEEHDELDRILNQALSAYPAEPLLGIESRILRRVRNDCRTTRWTRSVSSWGRALAAVLTLALVAASVFLTRNGVAKKVANPSQIATERPIAHVKARPLTRKKPEVEDAVLSLIHI